MRLVAFENASATQKRKKERKATKHVKLGAALLEVATFV